MTKLDVLTLFNPKQRLGDIIAKTKLIDKEKVEPELIMNEINQKHSSQPKLIWTSLFISVFFNLISILPILLTI